MEYLKIIKNRLSVGTEAIVLFTEIQTELHHNDHQIDF